MQPAGSKVPRTSDREYLESWARHRDADSLQTLVERYLGFVQSSALRRTGDAALDTWIFSAGNAAVKDVIVGGSHVVKDRRHINEDRIQKKFVETVRRLS